MLGGGSFWPPVMGVCNDCPSSVFQSQLSQSVCLCFCTFLSSLGKQREELGGPSWRARWGGPPGLSEPVKQFAASPSVPSPVDGGCQACPLSPPAPSKVCKINPIVPSSSPTRHKLLIPSHQVPGASLTETFKKCF